MPRPRSFDLTLIGLLAGLVSCPAVLAQDRKLSDLRLTGMTPGGGRISVTESWGRFDFNLLNASDADRLARVLVFYASQPDVHYGRDVWVPARSTLSTWVLMGPAPPQAGKGSGAEIQMLLYDRTGGQERLVRPDGQERVRSRAVPYRKRQPETALLLDEEALVEAEAEHGQVPQPESLGGEALRLARAFRAAGDLSTNVQTPGRGPLPAVPEAFDGLDHFLIASGRIGEDAAGTRALRHWVEQGGKVWVMLDRVEPEAVAGLLGDALDFQVVDRVGLTRLTIEARARGAAALPPQQHDRPVRFARVLLPESDRPTHTVEGWPVWFTRRLGRGTVFFTTLGARAWYRPQADGDPDAPDLAPPRATEVLTEFAGRFLLREEDALRGADGQTPPPLAQALQRSLNEEIGYAVIDRGTVTLILAGFLLATLALGVTTRWSRRPERVGWLAPAAAVAACVALVVLGDRARQAVPATVAVAQIVEAVPDTGDATVRGPLSAYRPGSGPAGLGAGRGGLFELTVDGLGGQTRRLISDDLGVWHWEGLSLPAGVRSGTFRSTAPAEISASLRLGPEGFEGELSAGPFEGPGDALLQLAGDRAMAVRLRPDGTFSAGGGDAFGEGQYLPGTLLSDRQQRRHEVYRELLKPPPAGRVHQRDLLMVWSRPIDLGLTLDPKPRTAGDALLMVPLRLTRPAAGARVTIPGPAVGYHRLVNEGTAARLNRVQRGATGMHLRFQLPPAVLPFEVERARLSARIEAPSRRVTVYGSDGGKLVEVSRVVDPLDPFRVELDDPRLLGLDEEGGLHLHLHISDPLEGKAGQGGKEDDPKWTVEYIELEVVGKTKG